MSQKEDESLEDYVERFQFFLKKSHQNSLFDESLKLIFLRGVNEDCMDALDLIGVGYISQEPFEEIYKACRNYSRSFTERVKRDRTSSINKSITGVSKAELRNLLSNMKEDIISHLSTQLDTLHINKNQEEAEATLTKYYPHCRQRKTNCKCKKVASISEDKQGTSEFHVLEGEDGQVFYIAQCKPWKPGQGMPQDPLSYNMSFPSNNANFPSWNP